ncbi:hypothetical protein CXB51_013686 [Gossypium anomalum]|uniref:DUF7745 domain-containing protein n=1 Tax=Gossypium anomalum TaxID=47600 RepID=A0A8J5ZK88_9ROSI|nr:hypothetical protein CXB51_013686 [Gossypium anomalum]
MGYVSKLSDYIRINVIQDNQHELKEIWDQWGIKAKQLFYNNHGDSQYLLDLGIDENLFRAITQYWNLVYSCFTFGKADMVSVVEEYSVLWRCPMIQVYSKADRIPTFMRKIMNVMGIGSELKWKKQEEKWAVLEFLPLPPLVRLNVVSNQSRIGYEEYCSTLYGKACCRAKGNVLTNHFKVNKKSIDGHFHHYNISLS